MTTSLHERVSDLAIIAGIAVTPADVDAIDPVRQLYLCAPVDELTIADRLDRIEREATLIRRELD
jgi:hypothetical protein